MLAFLYRFGQFLITLWIWSITFGIHQALIAALLATALLSVIAQCSWLASLCVACGTQLAASGLFFLLVHVLLDGLFGVTFAATEQATIIHPFLTSLMLGMVYASLQLLVLRCIRRWYMVDLQSVAVSLFFAHLGAAALVYYFLPVL